MLEKKCRLCDSNLVNVFLDLEKMPLSNSYLTDNDLTKDEKLFPLCVYVCDNCLLVQVEEHEDPKQIFKNYAYFSSFSETWLNHVKKYVDEMISRFKLNNSSIIIEIASNDGYLLQFFKNYHIPILGIEPAINVAEEAEKKGITTLKEFLNTDTAKKLASRGTRADLLIANNVLAHVPKLQDFVEALKILLKPEGIITLEFPHLLQLVANNQFDTIYHEHFSYFSFFVVKNLFDEHELNVFDVEELDTHGGSLRVYVKHESNELSITPNVDQLLKKEKDFGLFSISTYRDFKQHVDAIKMDLRDFIIKEKNRDKKIVGYGAAAKGNTLLNYCGINSNHIDYVVDMNPHKQGHYLPGSHIPIKDPNEIKKTKPDYVLILPWNIKEEIMDQLKFIKNWNGKFVIAIPEVKIIP